MLIVFYTKDTLFGMAIYIRNWRDTKLIPLFSVKDFKISLKMYNL
jgi:hypothetical protein